MESDDWVVKLFGGSGLGQIEVMVWMQCFWQWMLIGYVEQIVFDGIVYCVQWQVIGCGVEWIFQFFCQ